ncbi:hypothetical protein OSTOST_02863 [Ostertagia ostertagi]
MAELPNLGRHCGAKLCNQLDFRPIRCDACSAKILLVFITCPCHQNYCLVIAMRKITIVDKPEAVLLFQRLRKHTFRKGRGHKLNLWMKSP